MDFLISNFVNDYRERSARGFEGRDTLTPVDLARAMGGKLFEQLPDDPEKLKKMTFVDPACGTGIFGAVMADYLNKRLEPAISDSEERVRHIAREQIWMYDKSLAQVEVARELFPDFFKSKIIQKDVLNEEWPMKFDVVVGNPPFEGSDKATKLWIKFYERTFRFVKTDGIHSFVTPNVWTRRPDSQNFSKVSEILSNNELSFVNLNVNKYFHQIGEDIGYQVVKKTTTTENSKFTTFKNNEKTFEFEYEGGKIPFNEKDKIRYSIFNKVENSKFDEKLKDYFDKKGNTASPNSEELIEEKTEQKQIPVFYSASQVYYTEYRESFNLGKKLFFNLSGYYFKEGQEEKYMPILDGFVRGKNSYSVPVDSQEQGETLRNNYTRKLFRFYIEQEKTSGFNSGIKKLPWIGYENEYTDEEIYDTFNLSDKEIKHIQNHYD